jgi:hypothetical protein
MPSLARTLNSNISSSWLGHQTTMRRHASKCRLGINDDRVVQIIHAQYYKHHAKPEMSMLKPCCRPKPVRSLGTSQTTCHSGDVTGQVLILRCRVLRQCPGISAHDGALTFASLRCLHYQYTLFLPRVSARLSLLLPFLLLLHLLFTNLVGL